MLQFFFGDEIEIIRFRKILTEQPVGILVRASFPEMIRICEIYGHARLLFEPFPIGELRAIVQGESLPFLLLDMSECFDGTLREELRIHFRKQERNQISSLSIDERCDAHPLVSSHQSVALEIADPSSTLDNLWSLIDASFLSLFTLFFSLLGTMLSAILSFL